MIEKACPVVLRQQGGIEVLAFRHPLAGLQLVKGTIESREAPAAAALRELAEEAGITDARISGRYGATLLATDEYWHFFRVSVPDLPDSWTHHALDDGGHDFQFFWHPLGTPADDEWHPNFRAALAYIRDLAA